MVNGDHEIPLVFLVLVRSLDLEKNSDLQCRAIDTILTLFYHEEAHEKDHGVTGKNEVSTVDLHRNRMV
jgi:hypothetical protein